MIQRIQKHYEESRDHLVKQAYSALGDRGYAEDCVQETYERAIRYYQALGQGSFEGWMVGIFRNTIRDYLTYIKNNGLSQEFCEEDLEQEGSLDISAINKIMLLEEILQHANSQDVINILSLYYLQGYSAKAVSILTGATVFAVYNTASRFKKSLEEKYG